MDDLATFLRKTLADKKFSGSERAALAAWVADNIATDHQRGIARHTVFEVAQGATLPLGHLLDWLEDVLKVIEPVHKPAPLTAGQSKAFFSPGPDCLNRIIFRIKNCRRTADLCVFTITDDRISEPILAAHGRGVKVRVLTDNEKAEDTGSDIERFTSAGIEVRIDRTPCHLHHKFAIFDGQYLINGSYNWTRSAAEQNCENIVEESDPKLIAQFQAEFNKLWANFGC